MFPSNLFQYYSHPVLTFKVGVMRSLRPHVPDECVCAFPAGNVDIRRAILAAEREVGHLCQKQRAAMPECPNHAE
jgi:hypothetical protein